MDNGEFDLKIESNDSVKLANAKTDVNRSRRKKIFDRVSSSKVKSSEVI